MRPPTWLAACVLAMLLGASPAQAITNGTPDTAHGYVGALMATGGVFGDEVLALCTGTLIAPTAFLTAAHCVAPSVLASGITMLGISFAQDPLAENDADYVSIRGYVVHPDFSEAAFDPGLDVAVVVLAEPVTGVGFAQLPGFGELSDARVGRTEFSSVGYGMQRYLGAGNLVLEGNTRRMATSRFLAFVLPRAQEHPDPEIRMLIAVTAAPGTGGGRCFGDSGGPLLLGATSKIAGVFTGLGTPAFNCVAIDNYVRVDTRPILTFLGPFV